MYECYFFIYRYVTSLYIGNLYKERPVGKIIQHWNYAFVYILFDSTKMTGFSIPTDDVI